jgi:hypothetical protein
MDEEKYPMPEGTIQIYPAYEFHGEVVIIATKEALENLKQAITKALEGGKSSANVWASDGEGYQILIKKVDSDWNNPVWDKLPSHYSCEWINKKCEIDPTTFYLSEEK